MSELSLLFQDPYFVAIDKPAGLLVHRSWIASEAKEFALQMLRDQIGQRVYPVHRLDRPTSGILLFALDSDSARQMGECFANREVHKMYHAVVRGYLPEHGQIDYPLTEQLDKIADKQASTDKEAQSAVTDYMTLERVELPYEVSKQHTTARYSLVKLSPKTGRKHQLRRHMAHLRHPIIGDTSHGDGRQNRFFRQHFDLQRLLLAATGMEFTHPITKQKIHIQSEVPAEFRRPFQAPDAIRP
ncbi:tRNA pseudouridine(65) synthase TruC [Aliidiomarina sedimenti]|uniref:tRNA pseudouridine synthase C n=1 Tax=Aliidiomarina sedimenti TaxID=1933879 RepID=A0ABY0C2Z2_9GAMM|nr:tRNA pseudouridine(65) synthase TruC [Aliidiomarina sedimenti]RUO32044.1 tRNA pseudouridine(65) synthase TruC [Aliidiomarina sedimenti]